MCGHPNKHQNKVLLLEKKADTIQRFMTETISFTPLTIVLEDQFAQMIFCEKKFPRNTSESRGSKSITQYWENNESPCIFM